MEGEVLMLKDEERQRCEVWSRCMGYHRPTSEWNPGKQQEFKERVWFREPAAQGGEDDKRDRNIRDGVKSKT